MRSRAAVWAWLVLAGCQATAGRGDDGGDPEPVPRDEFLSQLPTLRCAKLRLCGQVGASDFDECVANARRYPYPNPLDDLADASRYDFDGVTAARCLLSLRHLDCVHGWAWSTSPAEPCPGVFRGAREPGSDCHRSAECIEGPCQLSRVNGTPRCAGSCAPWRRLGDFCQDIPCDPATSVCNRWKGKCVTPPGRGEACDFYLPCGDGLKCLSDRCVDADPAPVTCESVSCTDNQGCEVRDNAIQCTTLAARGEPCQEVFKDCQPGLFCDTDFKVSQTGMCTPWLDVGESCPVVQGQGCPDSQTCWIDHTCVVRGRPGDACPDGYCHRTTVSCDAATMTCTPWKMPGEPCTPSLEGHPCFGSVCDENTKVCTEECN